VEEIGWLSGPYTWWKGKFFFKRVTGHFKEHGVDEKAIGNWYPETVAHPTTHKPKCCLTFYTVG
jgi:hypothetical protein